MDHEELSRLWHKLNTFPPYDWEEDVKAALDEITDLQRKYHFALGAMALLRNQRDAAIVVVEAARRYNERPYGVENPALRFALDAAIEHYDTETAATV